MQPRTERIAKNTLIFFSRKVILLLVSLYATRVVLSILGAEDYGIYSVVYGLVTLLTLINSAMAIATSRFLSYAIGENDTEQVKKVFSACFLIHAGLAILYIILAETVGLYFFRTFLNFPLERQDMAFAVFQVWIFFFAINILRTPYDAIIISYEKISFYIILCVVEVSFLICVVLSLSFIQYDKLLLHSLVYLTSAIANFFLYKIYCNKGIETVHFTLNKDKKLYKNLIFFSGWNILGQVGNLSFTNGIAILINIFYGVIANAALGIATLIESTIYSFVIYFQVAFQPQIIKSYAAGDYDYFTQCILQASKFSFYMMFFIALPFYYNADLILQIWLTDVPDYTLAFTRLIIIFLLFETFAYPLWQSISATGNIKAYMLIESSLKLTNIPVSFLLLSFGFSPTWAMIIKIGINIILFFWRILFVSKRINLSISKYFREVIAPVLMVAVISGAITFYSASFFEGWSKLILSCLVSVICTGSLIYFVGLSQGEKIIIKAWIKSKLTRP